MLTISRRLQFGAVAVAYAAVTAMSAVLVFVRYMVYVRHPQDVAAAGGMYAAGDWMLEIFIAGAYFVPTLVLAFMLRDSEPGYTRYSQVLLGLSITEPLCAAALAIPAVGQGTSQIGNFLGTVCLCRLGAAPIILVLIALSRLMARFKKAKRMTNYAALIEAGTLFLLMGALTLPAWRR